MRGQGYNGASNMSESVGVQVRIKEEAPLATYVHCSGHYLNLVINKSCSLSEVRNVIDRIQDCCRYFLNSPRRRGALEVVVKRNVTDELKRKPLLDLCKTRWAELHSAYQHFYEAIVHIVDTLEIIGYKSHLENYGDTSADWDATNRSDTRQILRSITSVDFIVVFMILYQYLAGITVKLQKRAHDIEEAHEMIAEAVAHYKSERKAASCSFAPIYKQTVVMTEKVGSLFEMSRIASRQ